MRTNSLKYKWMNLPMLLLEQLYSKKNQATGNSILEKSKRSVTQNMVNELNVAFRVLLNKKSHFYLHLTWVV